MLTHTHTTMSWNMYAFKIKNGTVGRVTTRNKHQYIGMENI